MDLVRICPACNTKNKYNDAFCNRCFQSISNVVPISEIKIPQLNLIFPDNSVITITTDIIIGRYNLPPSINQNNMYVSRDHIQMKYDSNQWILLDMNSSNGTYINGEKIQPLKEYIITDGDSVSLAQEVSFIARYIVE